MMIVILKFYPRLSKLMVIEYNYSIDAKKNQMTDNFIPQMAFLLSFIYYFLVTKYECLDGYINCNYHNGNFM